jgi:prepilin-type N-terminal cleavage/methylation domain-containing protein
MVGSWELGAGSKPFAPSSYPLAPSQAGFTFIEILITISVIAVLFVPVMQLFSHALEATSQNLDLITATNLAKSEMEKVINLNMTKEQLKKLGDQVVPQLDRKPLEVNRTFWRVKREFVQDSDPLEVRIQVYKEDEPGKTVVTLVTLVEDMMWESVKAVPTG